MSAALPAFLTHVSRGPDNLPMAGLPTSREPALVLRIALWAALSALFTLAVVLTIALAIGALIVYPQTEWIKAIDLAHLAMR